jgi:hypothetical protein
VGHKEAKEQIMFLSPPLVARSKSEEEREEKPESLVNLEEPSFAMTMCLKIKVACAFCKAIDIFCL